jgi:putative protease
MKKARLLSPAGSMSKLKTALHFGADEVYLAGKEFGLRAYADNFTLEELAEAVKYTHSQNKKVYVTVNIFARNADFAPLRDYLVFLQSVNADAVIVSDPGVIAFVKRVAPALKIHLSTQANTLNKYATAFWVSEGVSRVVLARELSVAEIAEIKESIGDSAELEAFAHGAMCISYSGRCLLSNYLSDRDSNKGECVQCCRWEYTLTERGKQDTPLIIGEDGRGTYILSSRDLCAAPFLDKLIEAGVDSFKIEGRMKSEYYVGGVTKAYRMVLDSYYAGLGIPNDIENELGKVSHRDYTPGFYLGGKGEGTQSVSDAAYEYIAEVLGCDEERELLKVRQRNRFAVGDRLEILSSRPEYHNREFKVEKIYSEQGEQLEEGKLVCQELYINCPFKPAERDMLRRKKYGRE